MSELLAYPVYVVTGAAAGLMSGVFGIGGGLVMVPALLACFALAGVPAESIPAMALGTSLTAVCFASVVASREHHRNGNLEQPFSPRMLKLALLLAVGVMAGALVSTRLPKDHLLLAIAVFQVTVGSWMWFTTLRPAASVSMAPGDVAVDGLRSRWTGTFLLLTGGISSIGGIGGATLMIPYFSQTGMAYPKAAALSTFFGSVIGGFGFVAYALLAHPAVDVPLSIGYVSLPAFAAMAAGSFFMVRLGVRLSRRLSKSMLTRGFCCFLFLSGGTALLPFARNALAVFPSL